MWLIKPRTTGAQVFANLARLGVLAFLAAIALGFAINTRDAEAVGLLGWVIVGIFVGAFLFGYSLLPCLAHMAVVWLFVSRGWAERWKRWVSVAAGTALWTLTYVMTVGVLDAYILLAIVLGASYGAVAHIDPSTHGLTPGADSTVKAEDSVA